MKIRLKYLFILLGLSSLLSSCYVVSTLETDVLNPAKQVFPKEIYNIGVVSRMDLEVIDSKTLADPAKMAVLKRDSMILKNAVIGLLDGLAESPRFEGYKINPSRVLSDQNLALDRPLSWNMVNSIAEKYDIDMLISLTTASFIDTIAKPSLIFEGDGGKGLKTVDQLIISSNQDMNRYYYIMLTNLYWRLYDVRSQELSNYIYTDTLIASTYGRDQYPERKTVVQYFYDQMGDAGYKYSQQLAPYWSSEFRAWYPTGDKDFVKAAAKANKGDWLGAIEIWRELAESRNRKIASRACYNMGVAAEMMDKFDIAIEWVKKSQEMGLTYYPKYYLEVLEQRKKKFPLLEEQMK